MAEIIPMPALSPTMEEATIVKWNKAVGDAVESGDILCEVETDKAVMEYEAAEDGTLLKILIDEGGTCGIGDAIAIVGAAGEDIAALIAKAESQTEAAPPPPSAAPPATVAETPVARTRPPEPTGRVKASPLALKLAANAGLDVRNIAGSGPGGRVIKRDVEAAAAKPTAAPMAEAAPAPELVEQVIPITPKRKMIAERLAESKFTAPHYYVTTTVAMDDLMAARRVVNETAAQKVSLNAFLIAFSAAAIARRPEINASWEGGETIRRHGRVDVGLAVAQQDGLVAPVVRDCSRKGLLAIDAELRAVIAKARAGTLTRADYQGATFTISNMGGLGVEQFTAVINPPGSAILAVGMIKPEPVVDEDGDIVIRSNMKMTLSCDHRVIDGAVAAAFMQELKNLLENPAPPAPAIPPKARPR